MCSHMYIINFECNINFRINKWIDFRTIFAKANFVFNVRRFVCPAGRDEHFVLIRKQSGEAENYIRAATVYFCFGLQKITFSVIYLPNNRNRKCDACL